MVVINYKLDGTLHSCDNVLLCQRFVIQVKVKFTPKIYEKEGKLEYFRKSYEKVNVQETPPLV